MAVQKLVKKVNMKRQLDILMQAAEEANAEGNVLYLTTLDRYIMQLNIMEDLKVEIKRHGTTVKKEYVKGRKNLVVNPAISEYNRAAKAANQTVITLQKIVKSLGYTTILDANGDDDEL